MFFGDLYSLYLVDLEHALVFLEFVWNHGLFMIVHIVIVGFASGFVRGLKMRREYKQTFSGRWLLWWGARRNDLVGRALRFSHRQVEKPSR